MTSGQQHGENRLTLDQHMDHSKARYDEAAKALLDELGEAGYQHLSHVGYLVQLFQKTGKPYKEAVPILVDWLPRVTYRNLKEDIVRTLSVPWASPEAIGVLLTEFQKPQEPGIRWTIGNALSVVADDSAYGEVVRLVTDRRWGKDRQMLALALSNMSRPEAIDVLIELLGDDEVFPHAIEALGKLRAEKARPYIERFLDHKEAWIRREAKKAIGKIDKGPPKRRRRRGT